jgi:hypothetical protein
MDRRDIERLVQRWTKEGIAEGRLDTFDQLLSEDVVDRSGPTLSHGVEPFKARAAAVREAFADIDIRMADLLVDGDAIAWRWALGTRRASRAWPTGRRLTLRCHPSDSRATGSSSTDHGRRLGRQAPVRSGTTLERATSLVSPTTEPAYDVALRVPRRHHRDRCRQVTLRKATCHGPCQLFAVHVASLRDRCRLPSQGQATCLAILVALAAIHALLPRHAKASVTCRLTPLALSPGRDRGDNHRIDVARSRDLGDEHRDACRPPLQRSSTSHVMLVASANDPCRRVSSSPCLAILSPCSRSLSPCLAIPLAPPRPVTSKLPATKHGGRPDVSSFNAAWHWLPAGVR